MIPHIRDQFSSIQSLSPVWLFETPWTAARQASLSITNSRSPPIPVHWVGDAIQPSHPLLSPSPPALDLSQHQGLFKQVSSSHQVASVLAPVAKIFKRIFEVFNFKISPTNEYPGFISFRMDWLDLLVVQGTFKSLLQHHSSKTSILRRSAFFIRDTAVKIINTEVRMVLSRAWGQEINKESLFHGSRASVSQDENSYRYG